MQRLLTLLMLLVAWPAAAYQEHVAFEEVPTLSVIVAPDDLWEGAAYVQGEIVVTVRVSSLNPFEALDVRMPKIEGAVVETLIKPRTRKVSIYGGEGYVLERVIAIYPQASGPLVIPPIVATGRVEPEKDKPLDFVEESPEITIDVAGIDPRYDADWWLVSRYVTISETWSKPVDDLREGDVVRREITLTATGVPHERMPVLEHGRTRGIAFSDAGGTAKTERTADGMIATVTHAWDLKIGIGRTLYIAPIGVQYWHPGERAQMKAAVRGYRIEPLPPDEEAIATGLMQEAEERHGGAQMIAAGMFALLALPFVAILIGWIWALVPTRDDRRLSAACTAGAAPPDVYRAARAWAAASGIPERVIGTDAGPEGAALVGRLFGGRAAEIDPPRIATRLRRLARRRRMRVLWENCSRAASRVLGRRATLGAGAP